MPFESYWKKRTPTHWHTSHVKFTLVQEDHMLFFQWVCYIHIHTSGQPNHQDNRSTQSQSFQVQLQFLFYSFFHLSERWKVRVEPREYWTEPWLFHHHFILFLFTFNILLFSIWYYIKFNNFIHRFWFYL